MIYHPARQLTAAGQVRLRYYFYACFLDEYRLRMPCRVVPRARVSGESCVVDDTYGWGW
jgi:hypothetical protein